MHFCFLPLDGVKLFPTVEICLLSTISSSSTQISKMHHSTLQTNEVLSCKSVIILCSAEGLIVQTAPVWSFAEAVDVSALWWQKQQHFLCLCAVVGLARATKQTNIIVSVVSRNVNCGYFSMLVSKLLLVCLGTVNTMIYGFEIMGCNVIWQQYQWERII